MGGWSARAEEGRRAIGARRRRRGWSTAAAAASLAGLLACSQSGGAPSAAPGASPSSAGAEPTDTDKAKVRCAALGARSPDASLPDPAAPGLTAAGSATGWLSTQGNQLLGPDGAPFRGRGANLACPRGCGACACNGIALADSSQEVMRRIDTLVDDWRANFIRLHLESYAQSATDAAHNPAYLSALRQIVAHLQSKPGVYMVLSVWFDPSLDGNGWPTDATQQILTTLVSAFGQVPQVLFGIANEPQRNQDGALDAQVWVRMNAAAAAIRAAEAAAGAPPHIILAQGTGGWARYLSYYTDHPLDAGGDGNIAYEVHVYDHPDAFADRFVAPSARLPVVIGEFGPLADGSMTLADTQAMMLRAEAAGVPYLAWTFHGRCVPSLLIDTSGGGCGVGMPLTPSAWGQQLRAQLARAWGAG